MKEQAIQVNQCKIYNQTNQIRSGLTEFGCREDNKKITFDSIYSYFPWFIWREGRWPSDILLSLMSCHVQVVTYSLVILMWLFLIFEKKGTIFFSRKALSEINKKESFQVRECLSLSFVSKTQNPDNTNGKRERDTQHDAGESDAEFLSRKLVLPLHHLYPLLCLGLSSNETRISNSSPVILFWKERESVSRGCVTLRVLLSFISRNKEQSWTQFCQSTKQGSGKLSSWVKSFCCSFSLSLSFLLGWDFYLSQDRRYFGLHDSFNVLSLVQQQHHQRQHHFLF
jgi:hypothetical protein